MPQPSEKFINDTSAHFQCTSMDEAFEIAANFFSFSRLLLKLDKKRNAEKARKQELCNKTA